MSTSNPPPSMPPVGVPTSGNTKYVLVVVLLVVAVGGIVAWKTCGQHPTPNSLPVLSTYDAAPLSHDESTLPPPPPVEEPLPEAGAPRIITLGDPCAVRSC